MKSLLENDLLIHKGRKADHIVCLFVFSNQKHIGDAVACHQCPLFFRRNCQGDVFIIDTHTPISMIKYEEYVDRVFAGTHNQCCDLILYDDDKIAFVDMTCSDESLLQSHYREGEIVKGKRAKCRSQIQDSLDLLYIVPSIASYIDAKTIKRAILAYRTKDITPFDEIEIEENLSKSEKAWLSMIQELEQRSLKTPMKYGFTYQSIKYPTPYQW
jgi:hypothetical protein